MKSRHERDQEMFEAQKKTINALGQFTGALIKSALSLALDSAIVMWCVNHFDPGKLTMWDSLLIIIAVRTILPKSVSTLDTLTPKAPSKLQQAEALRQATLDKIREENEK